MKSLQWLLVFSLLLAGCAQPAPEPAEPPQPATFPQAPHAPLAQVMRAVAFPHSNVIFDTQSVDPEMDEANAVATKIYTFGESNVYGKWPGVETSALALAETANLLSIPGRLCENGKPAPVEREDWKMFTQGLVDAANVSLAAAKTKNLDEMVNAAGEVTVACQSCHDVYRDRSDVDRCTP
jgi:hypothetical protein